MARIADLLAAGRTFSFEFSPPKSAAASMSLGRTIAELEPLGPSFVSVTYGAGGSTREHTRDTVLWVQRETNVPPMAHLTCVGHTRAEIEDIIATYVEAGIVNVLALAGDAPKDPADARPSDYTYATDLIEHLREISDLSIGVAAHPEGHPRSPDLATDRRYLAEKLRMSDFATTQFFFDIEHYLSLVNDLADLGVTKPVVPGIMPVTNIGQVERMAELSGAAFPSWLRERLESGKTPEDVRRIGVDAATELCAALLEAGAPGLHFYTMNKSTATRDIYTQLGLPVA
ncbi:MAG: 5,10-methylenetetrahydrofolate reductase [Actinobacteria bacterium]|jgi:methylenetetrahydrofolate reductase (NADPH)|nr:5,10-methylenetetrahydrofolate reductase [Actinomycetota bacterium]MTA53424.1 5,10-methylenetetrahydrofolate reductase [Actinomycetota bacterium]